MILRRSLAGACLLFVAVIALSSADPSPAHGQGGGCSATQFGSVAAPSNGRDGAISADGTKIAFVESAPAVGGVNGEQLVVANYDGTGRQVVASDHEGTTAVFLSDPELNDDGTIVAVNWRPAGTTNYASWAIMDVASPSPEIKDGFRPRMSHDGTKVAALHIASGQTPGLTVYDLVADTEFTIDEAANQNFYNLDLSGNGGFLAYGRNQTNGTSEDLIVAVVDLASQTEIDAIYEATPFPLNISDDGSKVFFFDRYLDQYVVRSGGTSSALTSMSPPFVRFGTTYSGFDHTNQVMSGDGTKIVYTVETDQPYRTTFVEQVDVASDTVTASLYIEDPSDTFVRHMATSGDGSKSVLPAFSPLLVGDTGLNLYRWSACTGGMPPTPTPEPTYEVPTIPTNLELDYQTGHDGDEIPKLVATWVGTNTAYEVAWFQATTAPDVIAAGYSGAVQYDTVLIDEAALPLTLFPPSTSSGGNNWCVAVAGLADTNPSPWSDPVCEEARTCDNVYVTVRLLDGDSPTAGDDVILGTSASETIDALAGDDRVCSLGNDDTILGGAGDDYIAAGGGNDQVDGGGGADRILGGSGDDDLQGGAGKDVMFGAAGRDDLEGGGGVDRLHGGDNDDTIDGGAASDRIWGNEGNDEIDGGGGNDYMWGGDGDDKIDGRQGMVDRAFGGDDVDFCLAEEQTDCENVLCGIEFLKGNLGAISNPSYYVSIYAFDCIHVTENFNVYFNRQTRRAEGRDLDAVYVETVVNLGVNLEAARVRFMEPPWDLEEPVKEDNGRLPVYIRPGPPAKGFSPPNHIEWDSEKIMNMVDDPLPDLVAHEVFHQFQWKIEGITTQLTAALPAASWLEPTAEWASCAKYRSPVGTGYCAPGRWNIAYGKRDPANGPWNPAAKSYSGTMFFRWVEDESSATKVEDMVKAASGFEPLLFDALVDPALCDGRLCARDLHIWQTLVGPIYIPELSAPDRTIMGLSSTGGMAFQDLGRSSGTVAVVHGFGSPTRISVLSDTGPAVRGFPKSGVSCSGVPRTSTQHVDRGIIFIDFAGCTNARVIATNIGDQSGEVALLDVTDLLPTGPTIYNHFAMISHVDAFNLGLKTPEDLCVALDLIGYHQVPGLAGPGVIPFDDYDQYLSCWGGTVDIASLEAATDATEGDDNLCVRRDPATVTVGGTHHQFSFSTAPCV